MEKKMNNKGFSLVELIIVIAIMAVLIGVLAPQYLKYVERSRVSTDVTNAQEIASAVSAAIADGNATATALSSTASKVSDIGGTGKIENLDETVVVKSTAKASANKGKTFCVTVDDNKNVKVYAGESVDPDNIMYPTVGANYSDYVSGSSSAAASTTP